MIRINIEMPETCSDCFACYDCMYCTIAERQMDFETFTDKRADYCPLNEEWIPVSSVEEIPKRGCYWVTKNAKDTVWVDTIAWDDYYKYWRDDDGFRAFSEDLDNIVAYMPYFTPKPYKETSY